MGPRELRWVEHCSLISTLCETQKVIECLIEKHNKKTAKYFQLEQLLEMF